MPTTSVLLVVFCTLLERVEQVFKKILFWGPYPVMVFRLYPSRAINRHTGTALCQTAKFHIKRSKAKRDRSKYLKAAKYSATADADRDKVWVKICEK
jgi:hypothetical protein